ncbi:hypothetical protein E8E11_010003, partial [Didymella keratinophila]
MWEALRSLTFRDSSRVQETEEVEKGVTSAPTSAPDPKPDAQLLSNKTGICVFLRLPAEIRLHIYSYTDIGGNTIEVLSLPTVHTSSGTQCYRTYSTDPVEHQLRFRVECKDDKKYAKSNEVTPTLRRRWLAPGHTSPPELTSSSTPVKRKRQTRADLQLLVYELNSFAFSDKDYNYGRAIRAFTSSLTERELSTIQTVHWPLVNVLVYRRSLRGDRVEEPDKTCAEELRSLRGLNRIVLRYGGPEFNSLADKYNEEERIELRGLLEANGGWDYGLERDYRRTLAVRTAQALIAREDLTIK